MKTCTKCLKEKEEKEFSKQSSKKDGLKSQCKECISVYEKKRYLNDKERIIENVNNYRLLNPDKTKMVKSNYYQKNKESISKKRSKYYEENKQQINQTTKKYYETNKEEISQWYKKWREENKEILKEKSTEYYKKNKEEIKEKVKTYSNNNRKKINKTKRIYYKKNKEEILLKSKLYAVDNPHVRRMASQRYEARKKKLPNNLTTEQWENIVKSFNNCCAYCGKTEEEQLLKYGERLHQEHFIPLSKNGGYTKENIIVACKGCNCSKGNIDFSEWYLMQDFYSEERKLFLLNFLEQNRR